MMSNEWLMGQIDDDNDNDTKEGKMSCSFMKIPLLIGICL